jgi:hypothetical protein
MSFFLDIPLHPQMPIRETSKGLVRHAEKAKTCRRAGAFSIRTPALPYLPSCVEEEFSEAGAAVLVMRHLASSRV